MIAINRYTSRLSKLRKTTVVTALIVMVGVGGVAFAGREHKSEDLVLVNGKIHTFDASNTVASEVRIHNNKVVDIGRHVDRKDSRVIDLRGRTVIPGMVDNHVHFVRMQNLIGYDVRELETAFSVRAAQDIIKKKARHVPAGEFITAMGGMARRQFSEGRFPNLAELDAAAPNHPVLLAEGGGGPTQANTKARDILRSRGMTVADDGFIASGAESSQVYTLLATSLDNNHRKRQLLDESKFAFSVGLTTVGDQHGSTPGAGFLDRATGHDSYLELVRQQEDEDKVLLPRTRFYFPAQQLADLPPILENRWREFGNDMAKTAGIGEWGPRGADYASGLRMMADRNWMFHQHLISATEIDAHLTALENLRTERGVADLKDLHWTLGHVGDITEAQVLRANSLGVGIAPHPWRYLTSNTGGPAFRTILDKATVPVGSGLDGARVAPLNPWTGIYYMVTGKNSGRTLVNDGQQITREEAVKLYSGPQQGWFTREEKTLGGIGVGRYADLVVLDKNIFDKKAVPDDQIRNMKSLLTIVDGQIVHTAGTR